MGMDSQRTLRGRRKPLFGFEILDPRIVLDASGFVDAHIYAQTDTIFDGSLHDGPIWTNQTDVEPRTRDTQTHHLITGNINKSIYAINGDTSLPASTPLQPGDEITFSVEYTSPTAIFTGLQVIDFFPNTNLLEADDPDANDNTNEATVDDGPAWTISTNAPSSTLPPVGVISLGPNDTFYYAETSLNADAGRDHYLANVTPSIDQSNNSLIVDFGTFATDTDDAMTIHLLFTMTVNSEEFDPLEAATNSVQIIDSTDAVGDSDSVNLVLAQPDIQITKGIVASSSGAAIFSGAVGPTDASFTNPDSNNVPFVGIITSEGIRTGVSAQPIDADLTNAEAGDIVRYAIVLENQADSRRGAFDIQVADSLPGGVTYIPGTVQVLDGTGAQLLFTDLDGATDGSGLFGSGIELLDPGPTTANAVDDQINLGAIDGIGDGTTGRNIAIVFYDVTVNNDPGNTADFQNDASLLQYTAGEGSPDLIGTLTDSAVLTLHRIDLELEKFVSDPNPELGDTVTWTVTVTNNADNATTDATGVVVNDVYPAGQAVVASSSTVPSGDTFSESTGVWTFGNPLAPGDSATLTFDTIVDYGVEYTNEFIDLEIETSVDLESVEEGDTVNVQVTLTNNPESSTTNATGVILRDIIPSGLTYVGDSASLGSYNSLTRQWNLSSFSIASGQTITLDLETTVASSTAGSTLVVSPEIAQADQTDVDSTPNNTSTSEDDDSQSPINVIAATGLRNITGQAFLDEDNDGIVDGTEVGVNNIVVAVFDAENNLVGSTSTDFLGFYTVTGVPDDDLRLEFYNINVDTTVSTAQAPPADSDTVSSVAFLPASATDAVANLALYKPRDDAQLVTTCFVYSDTGTGLLGEAAIISFNADGSVKETLATYGDVGTTYGVAHNTENEDIFVGAFHRRHTIIGPDGNDAIYRVDSSGNISTFIELDDFFGPGSAGPISHDVTDYFIDAPAFEAATKVAFGDVEISDDNETIYTVNLFDRVLYSIPVGSPATPTSTLDYAPGDLRTITTFNIVGDDATNPTNGGIPLEQLGLNPTQNIRPFALQERDGLIYVGLVNSAQYDASGIENVTTPSDLHAYVYTLDPATGQFSDAPVIDFSLDYDRDPKHTTQTESNWHPWLDDFSFFTFPVDTNRPIYETQPILSDIEFDTNGDMILGFRDRSADQMGIQSPELDGGVYVADVIAFSGGDIIRAERVGDDQWTVEHHVSAGDDAASEYYDGEEFSNIHLETAQGALTQVPGLSTTFTTALDPGGVDSGGVIGLDNADGSLLLETAVFENGTFGLGPFLDKANGLGDLEHLNNLPLEIGNRVWEDLDSDGIQAAGEPGIGGVTLQI